MMLNYQVEPELNFFQGRTYISLVAFLFRNTRVRGIAVPLHRDFFEVNLRFHVRAQQDGELCRGVCFIREVVPDGPLLLSRENSTESRTFAVRCEV